MMCPTADSCSFATRLLLSGCLATALPFTSNALASHDVCPLTWDQSIGQPGIGGDGKTFHRVLAALASDNEINDGHSIYVGGVFATAGGVDAANIARWHNGAWHSLGSGVNDFCSALCIFDDGAPGGGPALYAGGPFTEAGGVSANRIARWNGSAWSAIGSGLTGTPSPSVQAMIVFDDGLGGGSALYIAGSFTSAGGVPANHIARWDGENWSALGAGMNNPVRSLAVFDDGAPGGGPALYAAGFFTTAGGVTVNRIARWDGTEWSALGDGVNDFAYALEVFDDGSGDALYIAGNFTEAGGQPAPYIAKWNGSTWSSVAGGTDERIRSLKVHDDGTGNALYVGGIFNSAGGTPTPRIARWDGSNWSALSGGVNSWVRAMVSQNDGSGPALYVAGEFSMAGGNPASRIAAWRHAEPAGPADLNCDGVVNVADLLILFDNWGECADCTPGSCIGDLNSDCAVDVGDLLVLFDYWG
jgi:trimeric autotransporter adhesin